MNCPKEIPDALLHEDWARNIHGQTLGRLNERGGLSPAEIIGNIERLDFFVILNLDEQTCVQKINNILFKILNNE